eukprot:COSAG02_NODE_3731_length_6312_cov_32.691453_6_plen_137_part_00
MRGRAMTLRLACGRRTVPSPVSLALGHACADSTSFYPLLDQVKSREHNKWMVDELIKPNLLGQCLQPLAVAQLRAHRRLDELDDTRKCTRKGKGVEEVLYATKIAEPPQAKDQGAAPVYILPLRPFDLRLADEVGA